MAGEIDLFALYDIYCSVDCISRVYYIKYLHTLGNSHTVNEYIVIHGISRVIILDPHLLQAKALGKMTGLG